MLAIKDYRCVVALHEERHFARAASLLGVTQPALTSRLRRIEDTLDTRLFNRGRSGVEPTPAGVAFIEVAQRIIRLAEEASVAAKDAQKGLGQFLRTGMTQIAANQMVVDLLTRFRREHPLVRVQLVEGTTASLAAGVEKNLLDVAFAHPPFHEAGLSEYHLQTQTLSKHTIGEETSAPIRYMRREAPVLMAEIDRKAGANADLRVSAEVNTALAAIILTRSGYGPCIVPDGVFETLSPNGPVPTKSPISIELGTSIIWRRLDRRLAILDFLDVCRER